MKVPKSITKYASALISEGFSKERAFREAIQRAYENGAISEKVADKLEDYLCH